MEQHPDGYYWIRVRSFHQWEPAQLHRGEWLVLNRDCTRFPIDRVEVVGDRLTPPRST